MSVFAVKNADGLIVNMVVADSIVDVALREGQVALPVGPDAEIGGRHDGARFARKERPMPGPVVERAVVRAVRALAEEVSPAAVARVNAILGPEPGPQGNQAR